MSPLWGEMGSSRRVSSLILRSTLSRAASFSEVERLVGARLDELAVELGVPLGKGISDAEPFVAKVGVSEIG